MPTVSGPLVNISSIITIYAAYIFLLIYLKLCPRNKGGFCMIIVHVRKISRTSCWPGSFDLGDGNTLLWNLNSQ